MNPHVVLYVTKLISLESVTDVATNRRLVMEHIKKLEKEDYYACASCGFSLTNRENWCDLGCGRDYNKMILIHNLAQAIFKYIKVLLVEEVKNYPIEDCKATAILLRDKRIVELTKERNEIDEKVD